MRQTARAERNDLARKATHVGLFAGAHVLHASATAVLLWTFAGPIDWWPLKAVIGLVVGAPWLVWLIRLPWTVRDLVGTVMARTIDPEALRVDEPETDTERADAGDTEREPLAA